MPLDKRRLPEHRAPFLQVIFIGHASTGSGWYPDFAWDFQNLLEANKDIVVGAVCTRVVSFDMPASSH